jgi:hypothetical protein
VAFLTYMGIFSKIKIAEREFGSITYAYMEHIGPYNEVGTPMMEVHEKLLKAGFNPANGIGIYYNDPAITPAEELRSEVGSVIKEENILSYMFGPMKVYPAFGEYLEAQGIEVPTTGIEFYDMENEVILFMMEL